MWTLLATNIHTNQTYEQQNMAKNVRKGDTGNLEQ